MKTIFDTATRDEIISRINSLNENSTARWGKMNLYQMLRHCTLCDEMFLGKKKYKRSFIGRLFGRTVLKNMLKDESPLKRNAPTGQGFKIKEENGDLSAEKVKWINLLNEYGQYSNNHFEHWFFGKMTKEQLGYFVFKHTDHHLRQFNS